MFKFQRKYFAFAVLLFIAETIIAVFINDSFVRPYFGDFLVVILIYYAVKSFWDVPVNRLAISVLLFAYVVEVLQYFKFLKLLGVQKSRLAKIILGHSFEWGDVLAYTLGIVFVLMLEKMLSSVREKGACTATSSDVS